MQSLPTPATRHSTSLSSVATATPHRPLALALLCLASVLLWPTAASADTYGRLIARHSALPTSTLSTPFSHVRPPKTFLLVVTEPTRTPLNFNWSVHCVNSARKESGGASGAAVVSSGHWVKTIRANWIKHPLACSGSVAGTAGSSPVLVRVFAQ